MAAPIHYRLSWENPSRYTYRVEVELSPSKGRFTEVALPAWRPGRYILQNYAAAVSHFAAYDLQGNPLPWRKVTKDAWQIQNPASGPIRVQYHFYARQLDAGSSYLTEELVYLNPINLLVYPVNRLEESCTLELVSLPAGWAVATALPRTGPRSFQARSYHHLVDCPILAAPRLLSRSIVCEGVTLFVHFWGPVGAKDLSGFLRDLCAIVQTQKRIWGGKLPLSEYHFLYLLVPFPMRHAVEHENSAMFVLPQEGAASEEALKSFLGISAHEFFHVWNVKRLRPAALWPYRYDREVYTRLHWFTEGFTDYYTTLTLFRAGILSAEEYWQRLSADLTQVENSLAYRLFSPAELSMDSWHATSVYRPPHFQGSFYAAGKRVAFLLDMALRRETKGQVTLDSLLRYLWERYYERGQGMPENAIEEAAVRLGGPALRAFFAQYVEGRAQPEYPALLSGLPLRVEVREEPLSGWGRIGVTKLRPQGEGLRIEEVLPGSLADRAGLEVGDLILTIGETEAPALSPDFWAQLQPGQRIEIGFTREGFPAEVQVLFDPAAQSMRRILRLQPTDPSFLKEE